MYMSIAKYSKIKQLWYPPTFTKLATIKFSEKKHDHTKKHSFMCSAPKNSYLSHRTYSNTSAELVEAHEV